MTRFHLLVATALALAARTADAAPCSDLTNGGANTVVYAQVGDTQNNLMKRLARLLRDNTGNKITLVWFTSGSCVNITAAYTGVPIATNQTMNWVPSLAEDAAWTPASPTRTCEMQAGKVPDIINSALFNTACASGANPPPATVHLTRGPVQAYVLAVPEASSQTAITFEEAYFVFGFGAAGMALPWVNEAQMFIRTTTKSTLVAWAKNLGVDPTKWHGVQRDGSPMVVADLEGSTAPNEAIGILGAEVYDAERASLNVLAYKAKGQYYAYYPDSTASAFDKQNVRDGHYTVWSPTIWMDFVDGAQAPANAAARYVIDIIAGHTVTPAPAFDTIDPIAKVGLVPDCAMRVTRSFEGGPLSLYTPAESCACKYESLVATSSCATCSETTPCASGVCRNGFCEVQ